MCHPANTYIALCFTRYFVSFWCCDDDRWSRRSSSQFGWRKSETRLCQWTTYYHASYGWKRCSCWWIGEFIIRFHRYMRVRCNGSMAYAWRDMLSLLMIHETNIITTLCFFLRCYFFLLPYSSSLLHCGTISFVCIYFLFVVPVLILPLNTVLWKESDETKQSSCRYKKAKSVLLI